MKNIIIAGASGMVGSIVLAHCLASESVRQVTSLVRRTSNQQHPKLQEVIINDFADYAAHKGLFKGVDTGFFCLGVYTGQVPDAQFKVITVDYAVAFAKAIQRANRQATLCLLSGAGADRTEKSRTSFARYKGMAENQISALGLDFHTFRPAYIYPTTPRKEPNLMYRISRTLYPVIKVLGGKNGSIQSAELGKAMFKVGLYGTTSEVLENRDILALL